MTPKVTAALLIVAAVLANLAFTALGSIFNYPDVLDEPAGDVLASFREHEGAVSAWFTVLALLGRADGADRDRRRAALVRPADAVAVRVGIAAAVVQVIGLGAGRSSCPATPPTATRPPSGRRATSSARRSARPRVRAHGGLDGAGRAHARPRDRRPLVHGARLGVGRRWSLVGVLSPLGLPVVDDGELHRLRALERLADRVRRRAARAGAARGGGAVVTRWLALGVLCASLLAIVVDNTIVNVALPTLARDLDADVSELQWVVDAYTLVFAGLLLLAGRSATASAGGGRCWPGWRCSGCPRLAAAAAGGVDALIACRAVMGAGAAFIMPATLSLLVSVFPDERERAMAVGIWAATAGLGVALGPVAGGVLLDHFCVGLDLPRQRAAVRAGAAGSGGGSSRSRATRRRPRVDWTGAASRAPAWSRWCGR